ncbi:helix-turn-helix domain-containing protein [Actinomyces culturomici]|uniref:helix-turn-helix domain-containing protein n=1 Tax=Actinomyces culturomici TaxID=1926276 RepID=UPI00135A0AB3|nr:helix-turn-helix domain-containing protein [Actinomyces culturomici]
MTKKNAASAEDAAPLPQFVGVGTASRILGCCPNTVRNMIATGDLDAYYVKGRRMIRIELASVLALLTPSDALRLKGVKSFSTKVA